MKVLVLAGRTPDIQSLSSGWLNAFTSLGYGTRIYRGTEAAFDVFDTFQPDLIWCHSKDLTREFVRAVIDGKQKIILFLSNYNDSTEDERNLVSQLTLHGHRTAFTTSFESKVKEACSDWKMCGMRHTLSCLPAADLTRYKPVPVDEAHVSDISYIGCYEYKKEKNLVDYVFPLLHDFDLKIYGYGNWPLANYLGSVDKNLFNTIVCSSKINLSVSYKGATTPSERIFKILACGQMPLTHLEEAENWYESDFRNVLDWGYWFHNLDDLFNQVKFMLNNPPSDNSCSLQFIADKHTYVHRVHQALGVINA